MNFKTLSTVVLGVALISACGRGKKDSNNEAVLADDVDVCGSVNTTNEDAKGSFARTLDTVSFNLYWMGGSATPINFWTNSGINKQISITAFPLSINELDTSDQSVKSTTVCVENAASVDKCKKIFEEILTLSKGYSDQKAKALEEGDDDASDMTETQKLSFSCASKFLTKEIEKLDAFLAEEAAE